MAALSCIFHKKHSQDSKYRFYSCKARLAKLQAKHRKVSQSKSSGVLNVKCTLIGYFADIHVPEFHRAIFIHENIGRFDIAVVDFEVMQDF